MITDKQGQEWLLQKLYDAGWRYYAKNVGGTAFLTTKKTNYESRYIRNNKWWYYKVY